MSTNCYIGINEESRECFLVDPAAWPPELSSHIRTSELKPRAVLLTHGHFDHIMGLEQLLEEYDIPVYACGDEKEILESAGLNLSTMMGTGGCRDRDLCYPHARAHGGRMLLLYRKGRGIIQRRYVVPRIYRQDRFPYREQQPACAFCEGAAVCASGRDESISGTYG